MMAKPSVLLPEPFGPISACTSPRLISRFTPLRIGFSSTATCKSVIFKASVIRASSFFSHSTFDICHSTSDLLMIKQRRLVFRRGDVARMMRHGQFVVQFQFAAAATVHLVAHDLVLNSHQPFE